MEKVCGNCIDHEAYENPLEVFCTCRFIDHKDPVRSTMDTCGVWSLKRKECACVKDYRERIYEQHARKHGATV